ncbi:MAG: hypothetical protein ACMUHY_03925, partial [Thermoplasmatota archaeon]
MGLFLELPYLVLHLIELSVVLGQIDLLDPDYLPMMAGIFGRSTGSSGSAGFGGTSGGGGGGVI